MIASLGNPGTEYAQTKHNVGFMLLDALAKQLPLMKIAFKKVLVTVNF